LLDATMSASSSWKPTSRRQGARCCAYA
jgi:hypothetical protein